MRVIDALDEQVHGPEPGFPKHLHAEVERVEGDIRDRDTLRAALAGVTHVCHLAAERVRIFDSLVRPGDQEPGESNVRF